MLGGIVGLGTFTFIYGQGHSYFSDDPESCVNCHDEDYKDVYNEWIENTSGLIKRLEKKIQSEKLSSEHPAVLLLKNLKKDGSRGIHNPDLYEKLIEDALNK